MSAVAGVLVFFASLPTVDEADAPIWPLLAFCLIWPCCLHPRVFKPLARKLLKPFGASELPPISYRAPARADRLLRGRPWVFGGIAILYMLRAVGGDVPFSDVPYLGGVGAIGAIVSV